jgi:hypothetical protein
VSRQQNKIPEVPGIPHAPEGAEAATPPALPIPSPGQVAGVLGEVIQGLPWNVINVLNATAAQLTRFTDREAGS